MPFWHLWQRTEQARRGLIERLIRREAPDTVIDARPAPPECVRHSTAVNATGPAHVPRAVVLLGPLPLQHRLRPAVPDLLFPIGAHRVPAVVPDDRRRAETQGPAVSLEPPAHVDVVAGGAELRIEPSDRLKTGLAKRHVAAGDVLSLAIAEEDVNGPARRARDALGDRSVARRGDIRSAHPSVRGPQESSCEISKPVRVGVGV